jgi:hypothetical protein
MVEIYSFRYAQQEHIEPEVEETPVQEIVPEIPIDESQEIAMVPSYYADRRGPQIDVYSPAYGNFVTTQPGTPYKGLNPNSIPAGRMVLSDSPIEGEVNIKSIIDNYIRKKEGKLNIAYITLMGDHYIERDITPDDMLMAGTGNQLCIAWDHNMTGWRAFIMPRIQRVREYILMA